MTETAGSLAASAPDAAASRFALWGRIVFGGSSVLFGVITLMWHDADTWQNMSSFWSLPFGSSVGAILMGALIPGGLGLMYPRTARLASMVLGIDYVLCTLICIPGIISAPTTYFQYGSFFEQLSLVCGALAVYAACDADKEQAVTLGRAARIGIGLCAISFTLSQVIYPNLTAPLVPKWIPPNQMFWAVLTTVAFALAAIAILINRQARLALRLLTLMLFLFGLLIWVPAVIAHPASHNDWSEFTYNYLITGAVWMVAALRVF